MFVVSRRIVPFSLVCATAASVAEAQFAYGPREDVSVSSSHSLPHHDSTGNAISADGRFVAFHTRNRLDTLEEWGDKNFVEDVFVHDRQLLLTKIVSVGLSGGFANAASLAPSISGDGRFIAFESSASNIVASDVEGHSDIFVSDRQTGLITRVSVDSSGNAANGPSNAASISADGQLVAFVSSATNLVAGDTNGMADVFVHDRASGQTTRISVTSSGTEADHDSSAPEISANGRYVAFVTLASNLVPGDSNAAEDVLVHDRLNGQLTHVSVSSAGAPGNDASHSPAISADGRHIAFASDATNLVAGDTNGLSDIFLRDRQSLQTIRVSVGETGQQATGDSLEPAISADGRLVVFASVAYNLIVDKGNLNWDAFQRDVELGTTRIISLGEYGLPEHYAATRNPKISAEGKVVTYEMGDFTDSSWTTRVYAREAYGEPVIRSYCFGDGEALACPCGPGGPESGCPNSFYAYGGRLQGSGVASVSADTALLQTSSLSGNIALYFQGTRWVRSELHDGLSCMGGQLVRIGLKSVAAGGLTQNPELGELPLSVKGAVPASGGWRYYQAVYRNSVPFCTSSTLNWTNGVRIFWTP